MGSGDVDQPGTNRSTRTAAQDRGADARPGEGSGLTEAAAPPRRSAPELKNTLWAMDQHLENCPECLRWGYELCDMGLVLSGEVIRARAAREALGLLPHGAPTPSPRPPAGPEPLGTGPAPVP